MEQVKIPVQKIQDVLDKLIRDRLAKTTEDIKTLSSQERELPDGTKYTTYDIEVDFQFKGQDKTATGQLAMVTPDIAVSAIAPGGKEARAALDDKTRDELDQQLMVAITGKTGGERDIAKRAAVKILHGAFKNTPDEITYSRATDYIEQLMKAGKTLRAKGGEIPEEPPVDTDELESDAELFPATPGQTIWMWRAIYTADQSEDEARLTQIGKAMQETLVDDLKKMHKAEITSKPKTPSLVPMASRDDRKIYGAVSSGVYTSPMTKFEDRQIRSMLPPSVRDESLEECLKKIASKL